MGVFIFAVVKSIFVIPAFIGVWISLSGEVFFSKNYQSCSKGDKAFIYFAWIGIAIIMTGGIELTLGYRNTEVTMPIGIIISMGMVSKLSALEQEMERQRHLAKISRPEKEKRDIQKNGYILWPLWKNAAACGTPVFK